MRKILTKIILLTKNKNQRNNIDYKIYYFSTSERIRFLLEGSILLWFISFLFYDSIIPFFILLFPYLYFYLSRKQKMLCKKSQQILTKQFQDMILAVSAHVQSGLSIENAFYETYRDICVLYGRDSIMAKELSCLLRRMDNNEQIEDILVDLAKRSGVEDISEFASVFIVAKRGSGDIRSIIAKTATLIGDKIEVHREINTIMSERKLEQKIMQAMPFFFIGYLSLTSKGFFDALHHNLPGILFMTGCLVVYVIACQLSERILEIEI